jgi:serine protease Do
MRISMRVLSFCFVIALTGVTGYSQTPARSATLRRIVTERGYLGVGIIELTDDRAKALGLRNANGVEVKRVEENSPAAKAGLKVDDVILEIGGKGVEDMDQFLHSISEAPGAKIGLTVWRAGAKHSLAATLETRQETPFFLFPDSPMPPMPPMPPSGNWDGAPLSSLTGSGAQVGFEGEPLSPQLADFFGVKDGVLVRTVGPKTPAERAGLKAGDVVTKVNGTPVGSPREIAALVRANRSKLASFTVVRGKKEIALRVEISEVRMPWADSDVL